MGSNGSSGVEGDRVLATHSAFAPFRGMLLASDAVSARDITGSSRAAQVGIGFKSAMQLVQHTIPNYEPKFLIRLQDRIGINAGLFHGFVVVWFQATAFGVEFSDLKKHDDFFLRFDWGMDDARNGGVTCCPGKTYLELAENLADYTKSDEETMEDKLQRMREAEAGNLRYCGTIMNGLDIGSLCVKNNRPDIGWLPWQRIPAKAGHVVTENLLKVLKRVKDRKYSVESWNCNHFADTLAEELNPEKPPSDAYELARLCEFWAGDANWPTLALQPTYPKLVQQSSFDDSEFSVGIGESMPPSVQLSGLDDSNYVLDTVEPVPPVVQHSVLPEPRHAERETTRAAQVWSPDSFCRRRFD